MGNLVHSLTLSRVLAVLTIAAVFAMAMRAPLDTDTLWHLRAGEWQVEHRALLRVDLFSHTRYGEPWVNHSWLSQVALYGAYAALGDLGLALYTAILATVGMAFVYRMLDANAMVRAFVTVLAAAAAAVFWSARPQMMSFVLSAAVLSLLWQWRGGAARRLWLIPPLMTLWANLHGGFAIGFILMVLALAGELARWLFDGVLRGETAPDSPKTGLRPAGHLAAVGLVSAAAVSLNPYGPRLLFYPFRTVGIGALQDFIQEWASPDFHQAQTWPFIWLLLGTLAVAGLSSRRLDWREALMVGGTAYGALLAARNIATFAAVAAPVLALHLQDWLDGLGLRLSLDRRPRGLLLAANWAIVVLAAAGAVAKSMAALDADLIGQARRESLPVDAVSHMQSAGAPGPLFNSYNWGGYLIWAARDYPVYVDGRTDLYDDELLAVYLETAFAQPGWEANLDAAGINTVLVETSSPLARVLGLSAGWTLIYEDDLASLFVRDVPLTGGAGER